MMLKSLKSKFMAKQYFCKMCNIKVAEIESGSKLKKDLTILCKQCYDRCKIAVDIADSARNSTPDFLNNLFSNFQK